MDLKHTIFITGAASGIGRATSLLFSEKGWFVGLFDVDEKGLAELAGQIGEKNSCYKKVDVSNAEDVKNAVTYFSDQTGGRMDVLFNNAGILQMGSFEKISQQDHIKTVEVNFIGIINGICSSLELLKQTENSRIISMCSASAVYGTPDLATYSATKFAVRGLTEALDIEFEHLGITVCDILVPYVQTPMLEQEIKAASIEKAGIHITPDEVALMVWDATRSRKLHWTKRMRLNYFLFWLFPFIRRGLMKKLTWEDK